MIVSYTHQFMFVHIPKAAGSSVRLALQPYAHQTEHLWVNRLLAIMGFHSNHFGPYQWKRFCAHATTAQVQRQLPKPIFRNLFKFTFVRNPWDLMVSCYHFILQSPGHHRHRRVKALGSFEAYLKYESERDKLSQRDFLFDRHGAPIVDFVGRFESLNEDFQEVCGILGLDASLRHTNRSSHKDYRDYYNARTIELVRETYREDIELLSYEFDGVAEQNRRIRLAA